MSTHEQLNDFLMDIFNRINKIEEQALATGLESEVSVTEIHILEKIGCECAKRMSDVAKAIGVTLATLTVACDKLENKDLIFRSRDKQDKRVVKVSLTPKGIVAYRFHEKFHESMIDAILKGFSPEEEIIFSTGIKKLQDFFLNNACKNLTNDTKK